MILHGANLDNERVHTVLATLDDEIGHEDDVRRGEAQGTRPVLCTCQRRRVNDKLITVLVKGRRRFQPAHKRAVAQLRLHVRPDNLARLHQRQPFVPLLRACLQLDGGAEHDGVVAKGGGDAQRVLVGVEGEEVVAVVDLVVQDDLAKVEAHEILRFPVCVDVGRGDLHGIRGAQDFLDPLKRSSSLRDMFLPRSVPSVFRTEEEKPITQEGRLQFNDKLETQAVY